MIRYLFDVKSVSEVFGDCDVKNVASWRLMERIGFERKQRLDNQSYKNDTLGQPIIIQTYLYELKNCTLEENIVKKCKIMNEYYSLT